MDLRMKYGCGWIGSGKIRVGVDLGRSQGMWVDSGWSTCVRDSGWGSNRVKCMYSEGFYEQHKGNRNFRVE